VAHRVSFIGEGNRSSRKKLLTCRKQLTNFITQCCIMYISPWTAFELTTSVVIGTDCTGSCKLIKLKMCSLIELLFHVFSALRINYIKIYKPFIFLIPFFSSPPFSYLTFVNSFYLHFWPKLLYIFLSVSVSPLSRMVPFGKIYSLVLLPSKFPIKPVTSPLNSSGTVAERVSWRVLTCIFSWIPEKINHCSHLKFHQYL
jgi:hypothetical protein